MHILMFNAINLTLQRWERISLGFLSTKIHKVDQNINRNKSSFLAKQKEREYSEEKKTYVFASERNNIWVHRWLYKFNNDLQHSDGKIQKCYKRYSIVLFMYYSFGSLYSPIINFFKRFIVWLYHLWRRKLRI